MKFKFSTALFLLAISSTFQIYAATGESQNYLFDGTEDEVTITLNGSQWHTEYEYRTVPSTCYRQVFSHYETYCYDQPDVCEEVCSDNSDNRPSHGNNDNSDNRPSHGGNNRPSHGRGIVPLHNVSDSMSSNQSCTTVCHSGGQTCDQNAVYRTESYYCEETITIPHQIFDNYTKAEVIIEFGALPLNIKPNEIFELNLEGETLSLSVKGSGKLITLLQEKNQEIDFIDSENTKLIKSSYVVVFAPLKESFASIENGIKNIKLDDNLLKFSVAKIDSGITFTPSLKWKQKTAVAINKKMFEGKLSKDQFTINSDEGSSEIIIDLKKINGKKINKKRKQIFEISGSIKFNLPVLNKTETLPSFSSSVTFKDKM